jgi:hypothetical protein
VLNLAVLPLVALAGLAIVHHMRTARDGASLAA